MATISAMGVGSGIDVRGLVNQLVAAERQPQEQRIARQEKQAKDQISALGRLKNALADLGKAMDKMKDPASFRAFDVRVLNESIVSASVRGNAPPGSYEVEVQQLAQSQRLATNAGLFGAGFTATDQLGAGDVTITLKDGSTETFTLADGASSLQDLQNQINASSTNVRASVVNDGEGPRLTFTSLKTGEANGIAAVSGSGSSQLNKLTFNVTDETDGFTQLRAAKDAILVVDGLTITRTSNQVNDVIDGVDLTLTEEGTTRVGVTEKEETAREAVQAFVDAYNALRRQTNQLGSFNADAGTSAALNGDSTLRGVQFQMGRLLGNPVAGMDGSVRILADLGISTQRDGTLSVDQARLDARLAEDPDEVIRLFTDKDDGLVARMQGMVEQYTGRDNILDTRTKSLERSLRGLEDQRDRLDYRMERVEARLIAQFSAMDAMVAQMNQTSQFLDNQLQMISNMNRKK
ncbi:flagellar filament capping protein FliD [Ectothiorhodospira shaposhnikovii]|uniref:flagellar filament capping protein FliD n=1 Tax=Ectothiorhodospira shaposhnikovii TaxID=1054 RepID=UPI001EE7B349|nr:flagellar filament capping protein FliD [Ectothiorhodospira shaposhnikovii]MCG5513017.1 flagellar filament capping protein FliD [Ectothiorhodospira shaposhnikovii]